MHTVSHRIYQFQKIDCTSVDLPQGNATLKQTTMQHLVKKCSIRKLQQKSSLYYKLFHGMAKACLLY